MSSTQLASACRQIGRLFGAGTLAGLGEGQLLDRFVARRDDDAFEAIVARHGPMVLAVCRSLLRDPNDVDDAFQAVFLVLVKRADSVRHRDLLGPWLHGVARRIAIRARSDAMRRRDRPSDGPEPRCPGGDDLDRLDERASIHDEVQRLPSSYRAAIVLCYFEGRTHEEAAHELGWPVGTVRGRLARARDLLRGRLARRGVGLTSGALLATLARESEAAVPGVLLESTTKAAALAAAGPLATMFASSAIVSSRALALAQGVLPAMTASKLKLAATLVVAGLVVGPGASAHQMGGFGRATSKTADVAREKTSAAKSAPAGPAGATPREAETIAEERLRLAEEALSTQLKLVKQGELNLADAHIPLWNSRVLGERIATGRDQAEAFRFFIETSRDVESLARNRLEKGEGTKMDLTRAQFDRIEAEDHTRQIWNLPPGPIRFPLTTGGVPEGQSIAKLNPPVKPADTTPKPEKPAPAASTPSGSAAERLRIAEEAIAALKQLIESPNNNPAPGFVGPLNMQLRKWEVVADQARHDLGRGPDPGHMSAVRALDRAREAEAEAKRRSDAGQGSKFDYLSAQLARVQAQEQVDRWAASEQNQPAFATAEATALKVEPGPNPGRGAVVKDEITAGGGGAGLSQDPAALRPRRLPKMNPADAEGDKAIEEALEKTGSIKFPEGTTLEEILTTVRESTKDSRVGLKKGVPFYVDPIVLIEDPPGQEKRKRIFKTIAPIELDDVPLRVALRLALDQFSLSYQVRDRMVYIMDEDLLDLRSEGATEFRAATGWRNPLRAMGGGMGGMGGGMGGMGGGMGGMGGMGGGMGGMGGQPLQGGGLR